MLFSTGEVLIQGMRIKRFAAGLAVWQRKDLSGKENRNHCLEAVFMKKAYRTPKAVVVDFAYDENVVAESVATCSGSVWVWQTEVGCEEHKYTDYMKARSSHPCDMKFEGYPFPN